MSSLALCAVVSCLLVACGGASTAGSRGEAPARGIEAAGLPFRILRARGGQEIGWNELLSELGEASAVCVGENHRNPHDHWAQLRLLDDLTARNRKAGVTTALGMEMFQRPFQGVLDDFAAHRIDEEALLSRSGWSDRWGFDWKLYRPMVFLARDRGAALLALNAPRELTKKVSHKGMDKLAAADRGKLPEMVLNDAEHRAWWDSIMEEMGDRHGGSRSPEDAQDDDDEDGEHGSEKSGPKQGPEAAEEKAAADRLYAAQVLWDESMAEAASAWLEARDRSDGTDHRHRRLIVILAGNGHCHESAIVRRIERRGVPVAVSVRPIIDDGEGNVAELLAAPENDYLFVMTRPRQ